MASEKLTALGAIPTVSASDVVYIVDTSDTTDDAAGSSKKVTLGSLGSRFLIQEIPLVSAGEFDFTSIPAGFNRLHLHGKVRGDVTGTFETIQILFNEDTTTSNYHSQASDGDNGSAVSAESTSPIIAYVPAAGSPTNSYAQLHIMLEDYAGSHSKTATSSFMNYRESERTRAGTFGVINPSLTAAITRLRIRTDNNPTDGLLGTLRLYGEF